MVGSCSNFTTSYFVKKINMKDVEEEKILLYSTYTILYLNDTACNLVKEVETYMHDKDKESKKIFGALIKRVNEYLEKVNSVIQDKVDYFADYNTEMDDLCYDATIDFKNELFDVYSMHNLGDCEYLTQVETMRSMIDLALYASQRVIENASKKTSRAKWLNFYVISDISRVGNNFANWTYRKLPKDTGFNVNDESDVMKKFRKLSEILVDFKSFDVAYRKAIECEKERNNK